MPRKPKVRSKVAAKSSTSAVVTSESPAKQFAAFLSHFDAPVAKTARAALRKMRPLTLGAIEMVYDNYNGLVVGFCPTERASEAILSIAIFPDHVTLCFLQGKGLPDPHKLLKGGGNQVRHYRLTSADDLDLPAIRDLIAVAAEEAMVPFDPEQKRRLVIKSVSAKQRSRKPLAR